MPCPQSRKKPEESPELRQEPSRCSTNPRQFSHTTQTPATAAAEWVSFPYPLSLLAVTSTPPTPLNGGAGAQTIVYCWGANKIILLSENAGALTRVSWEHCARHWAHTLTWELLLGKWETPAHFSPQHSWAEDHSSSQLASSLTQVSLHITWALPLPRYCSTL